MDLKQLNRQYFLKKDMYSTVLDGLSSNLISYRNGIMYIEVVMNTKWKRSYDFTAYQVAHDWKDSFSTLKNALGCKIYIIDKRRFPTSVIDDISRLSIPQYQAKKGILFRSDQLN
jgi:hypothetical protein